MYLQEKSKLLFPFLISQICFFIFPPKKEIDQGIIWTSYSEFMTSKCALAFGWPLLNIYKQVDRTGQQESALPFIYTLKVKVFSAAVGIRSNCQRPGSWSFGPLEPGLDLYRHDTNKNTKYQIVFLSPPLYIDLTTYVIQL